MQKPEPDRERVSNIDKDGTKIGEDDEDILPLWPATLDHSKGQTWAVLGLQEIGARLLSASGRAFALQRLQSHRHLEALTDFVNIRPHEAWALAQGP